MSAVDVIGEARAAFLKYDQDGSGYVDQVEIQHLLSDWGMDVSDISSAELGESAGGGEDGKYDFSEFTKLYNALGAKKGGSDFQLLLHNVEF